MTAPDTTADVRALLAGLGPADADTLRLYVLADGDTPIAMMLTFHAGGRLLGYNSGFDPAYRQVSAGMTLTGMMIEHAADAGVVVCDFLRGNESYKYRFGAADRPIELRLFMDGSLLRMELRDWGSGVVPKVDRPAPDPLTPGGIGVPCLRRLLDSIDFVPQSDGMLLKMTRRLDRSTDALA